MATRISCIVIRHTICAIFVLGYLWSPNVHKIILIPTHCDVKKKYILIHSIDSCPYNFGNYHYPILSSAKSQHMHIINKFNLFVHILFHPQEPQILFGYNHLICFILFAIKLLAEEHSVIHKIYNHKMCSV